MSRGYVIENGYLIERLALEYPIPTVSLCRRNELKAETLIDETDIACQPLLSKDDYPCVFRSLDNDVLIYSKHRAIDVIENSVKKDLHGRDGIMFKKYHIPPKLTYSKRETIEKLVLEAMQLGLREKGEAGFMMCAMEYAKKIEYCFASGL